MNYLAALHKDRLAQFELYLLDMTARFLADFHDTPYEPPDPYLSTNITYFPAILLAPSDRRMIAANVIGVPDAQLSPQDKALNSALIYWYGPTFVLTYLTGITDLSRAHVDFTRVANDQDYVEHLRENIAFARSVGHSMWTTTELHTSLQTEGRNFCRKKYNDPTRKASSLDIIEWMASLKQVGWIDKVLEASTLEAAYNAYTQPNGIGPFFGGNSTMMISNIHGVKYTHEEAFCAPGKGSIDTLDWLFAGTKVNPLKAILWLWEQQETLLPNLFIPDEFQNLEVSYGPLLTKSQTRYTPDAFEVGLCQYSVYRRLQKQQKLKYGKTPTDLSAFKRREDILTGKVKPLLEF